MTIAIGAYGDKVATDVIILFWSPLATMAPMIISGDMNRILDGIFGALERQENRELGTVTCQYRKGYPNECKRIGRLHYLSMETRIGR